MAIIEHVLPVSQIESAEGPVITALEYQEKTGSVLCGLMFAAPCLLRLNFENNQIVANGLKLEEQLDGPLLGVINGLESYTTGDTAFCTLHHGFLPAALRRFLKREILQMSGSDVVNMLTQHTGGMGSALKHSVFELNAEFEFQMRVNRDSGTLLDVMRLGDFVFGLSADSVWREPYLNPEKREVLRRELGWNTQFHRDSSGLFWFMGENGQLFRMGQMDNKAKPTTLKLPAGQMGFFRSSPCRWDGWLYGVGQSLNTLFRIRRNPVSAVEEFQKIVEMPADITAIHVVDREDGATLWAALRASEGVELWSAELSRAEDPEFMGDAPRLEKRHLLKQVNVLGSLTSDSKGRLWAGEGYLGAGLGLKSAPRVFVLDQE